MEKTYIFGEDSANANMLGLVAPLLQQRGIDPNVILAMSNNGGFGNQGSWFVWIILLALLWGNNGFGGGFGGNNGTFPIANMLNNDTGRELLMSAIQGNSQAISQLAATLNCDFNAVQSAIHDISQQICHVGNQVGLSSQQVINAIQLGNMSIAQLLSSCCCNIQDAITRSNYENQIATLNQTNQLSSAINTVSTGLERGFSQTAYETAAQTCALQNTIKDSTNDSTFAILSKLDQIENNALQDKINALQEKNSQLAVIINNAQQTSMFNQMIGQATAPINAALAGLTKEIAEITCKLPQTVTLPYSPATAVPTCALYNGYGFNNLAGYGFGWNGNLWS